MSDKTGSLTIKSSANAVLIALFLIVLWLPTFDYFFHFDQTPAFNEKRMPAPFPQFKPGLRNLKEYITGLEAFFDDHFGFRKQLIHWHTQWEAALFQNGNKQVMIGRDGWLYFAENPTQTSEDFRGMLQLTPEELSDYQHLLEQRRDWLAQRGIQYVFVVVPDKQSIYPEYVPAWLKPVRHHKRLDQFIDYMHSHSTVMVPDLRPALLDAKKIAPTYYKIDSHWNAFGGFIGCQEIIKVLSRQIPGLVPLSLDSFEFKKENFKDQDLPLLLGVYAVEDDFTLVPGTNLPAITVTIEHPEYTVPAYFTSNPGAKGTILVFRDSFGPGLNPLRYSFGKAVYLWGPGECDYETIEEIKPDVVISEIVERHFAGMIGQRAH